MPVNSAKQFRWAHGVASGSIESSLSKEKAREFIKATPKSKRKMFAKSKK